MALEALAAQGMAVAYWSRAAPDRPALVTADGDRTFAQLNARANQLVHALRRRGLGAGDAVALLCRNRPEFAEVRAACLRAGWRLTPVNWHLTGEEAGYVVADCQARALVADGAAAPAAEVAAARSPGLAARLAVGDPIGGFEHYDSAVAVEQTSDIDDPVLGGTMLYTSGTTGRPKGVWRTPRPTVVEPRYQGERHRHLCTGPLYHAAPLAISLDAPLANGVPVVLMASWDAEGCLRLVHEHRITHTHMVPTMFHRLLALPAEVKARYDVSSLRVVVHGAAPCPVHVKKAMIEWFGPVVTEYYAATEGVGTLVDAKTWSDKLGTVGRPTPPGQVFVGDEEARPLPPGEVGLVWLRSPPDDRFRYFGDEAKTVAAYRGDHFTLGDVGYVDEDGYLFLTDRSADLVISGGVNIYPAEVDAVLLEHPAVGDAAAIGVAAEDWGEEVLAVVEPQPGISPSPELAEELIAFCRTRLAHYKCPRRVDFVDRLPRLDNGKVYKRLLRERYRS